MLSQTYHTEVTQPENVVALPRRRILRARERRLVGLRGHITQVTSSEAVFYSSKGRRWQMSVNKTRSPKVAQRVPTGSGADFLNCASRAAVPALDRTVVVMCNAGTRSLFAAGDLLRLGYHDMRSVLGGFTRWKSDSLPINCRAPWIGRPASAIPVIS